MEDFRAEILKESIEQKTEAVRTTDSPETVTLISEPQRVFFGRRVLRTSLTKKELTAEKIRQILPQVLREHEKNVNEIGYLYNYYKGKQPILKKQKVVRPEINNKVLENHAFEIVEFKKAYIYGEPVQYVQKGEKNNEAVNPEISKLNKYMESEDKASLDKEIAEWQYICGTAYRWVDVDNEDNHLKLSIKDIDYKNDGSKLERMEETKNGFKPLKDNLEIWITEKIKEITNKM